MASLVRERNLLTPQSHAGLMNSMRVHERPLPKALTLAPPFSRRLEQRHCLQKCLEYILHFDGRSAGPRRACFLWFNSLTSRIPFAYVTGAVRFLAIDPAAHCMTAVPRIQSYYDRPGFDHWLHTYIRDRCIAYHGKRLSTVLFTKYRHGTRWRTCAPGDCSRDLRCMWASRPTSAEPPPP
jgi:hypothetical protein